MKSSAKKKLPSSFPVAKGILTKQTNKNLPTSKVVEGKLMFSYKYFKCDCIKDKEFNNCFKSIYNYAEWITYYLKRLSEISTMTLNEINNSGKSLRFHPVENKNLIKLKKALLILGIDVEKIFKQNESEDYYELSFGTGNGRMFGYLVNNIYFVLLLDPNHLIYPSLEKGGLYDLLHKRYNPWDDFS